MAPLPHLAEPAASRILRSRLGRIIRDIRRKIEGQPALEQAFALPLGRATQIRSQQQRQRGWKLYSLRVRREGLHAPPPSDYCLRWRCVHVIGGRRRS
ncbi:hypothetical protein ACVME8_005833 [Bradyrhizobium diazoefficiens]